MDVTNNDNGIQSFNSFEDETSLISISKADIITFLSIPLRMKRGGRGLRSRTLPHELSIPLRMKLNKSM